MLGRIYGGNIAAPSWEGARPGNQPAKPKRRIQLTSANLVEQTPVEKEKSLLQRERLDLGDQHFAMIDDPAVLGKNMGRAKGSKGMKSYQDAIDNMSAQILAAHRQDDDLQKLYAEQRKAARKPSKKKCVLAPYSKLKKGELVETIADNLPLGMMIRKSELQRMTVKDLRKLATRFCKTGSVKGGTLPDEIIRHIETYLPEEGIVKNVPNEYTTIKPSENRLSAILNKPTSRSKPTKTIISTDDFFPNAYTELGLTHEVAKLARLGDKEAGEMLAADPRMAQDPKVLKYGSDVYIQQREAQRPDRRRFSELQSNPKPSKKPKRPRIN